MTITNAMANATTGLSAAGKRADIVSNNIANASTPGYSRREVAVSELILNGGGAGVSVDGVTRAQDAALTREKRNAAGVEARDQAIASAWKDLDQALGGPDDSFSLFNQYQGLETALRNLGDTPESLAGQATTLDAAKSLASSFNQLAKKTQTAREAADATIARDVEQVNANLKQIEKLNASISKGVVSGADVSALEDQRKSLIDQISAMIPVREVPRSDGAVDIMTNEGVFLLAGTARAIQFTQTGAISPDLSLSAGTLSGLSVDGVDITPGGGGAQAAQQGAIAGQFAIRDQVLPDFQAKIDGLAGDLISRFDGIDSTLAPGEPGLFTDAGAQYNPANIVGISGRIAVNAAVDPDRGGALWRLRDGLGAVAPGPTGNADFVRTMLDSMTALNAAPTGAGLTGQFSAASAAAGVATAVGTTRMNAESALASSTARAQSTADAETQATGVDTDQELQKLVQIQQAYSANARVIQIAKDMLDKLMEL